MEQLFYHGNIITMESPDDHPEAVLVRDGRILAVGDLAALRQETTKSCQEINLQGKTLMPSFIDGHGHFSLTMRYTHMADLSSATCFSDIIKILKTFLNKRNLNETTPLFGYSYDHNFLQEQRHPTKDILDQVSTTIPIVIWHTTIHMAVVNSKALEVLNITTHTPNPQGGIIGHYPNSHIPNGYLEEMAINPLYTMQAQLPMNPVQQVKEAQELYLRYGITTVQDGEVDYATVDFCRQLAEQGLLYLDVVAYLSFHSGLGPGNAMQQHKDCIGQYQHHYKIGGYKILLDGSPQCKSAWMRTPYENSDDFCGYPWLNNETLETYLRTALLEKQQILAHCNGDAAAEQYLTCYEKVWREFPELIDCDLRPTMIHCQTVQDDQLDRMKVIRMIPSFFVAHVNYWGDIHLKNLGPQRGQRISPVRSALERDLIYNFHTDTPVVKPDIFHTIWAAVNRKTMQGVICGAEQKISVYQALQAVTCNAAYAYFEEDSKGSIRVGKRADLIIIDKNPLTVDPMTLNQIQVLATYKDGQLLYQK